MNHQLKVENRDDCKNVVAIKYLHVYFMHPLQRLKRQAQRHHMT